MQASARSKASIRAHLRCWKSRRSDLIDQPSHLTNDAADFLRDSDCNRIYFIQSKRWIAYTRAKQIFDFMNRLLVHPRTTRMPSLAVYGNSGMGKSILI